jgi:hypothetical protein
MANKYSSYELKPYVSQFVDPGTTEIAQVLRQRWDKNKADHDKLQQMANATQVGKGDQKFKDAAIEEIRGKFDKTIKSNNYENADMVVSEAVNSFMANEPLKAAAKSYQWWEESRKKAWELQAEGHNVLFNKVTLKNEDGTIKRDAAGNPIWVDPFDLHESYSTNEETGETTVNIYTPELQKQLPWQQEMENLVKNIGSDPVMLQRYNLTNEDLNGYLMYGQDVGYFNKEKLKNISSLLMDNYMSSDSGIQQNRALTQERINPLTGEHYTADEAFEKIFQQLQNTAEKQRTASINYREDKAYWEMLKNAADKGDENAPYIINPTISAGVKNYTDPLTPLDIMGNMKWSGASRVPDGTLKDKYFNEDGNFEFTGGGIGGETFTAYDVMNNYDSMDDLLADYQEEFNAHLQEFGGTAELEKTFLKNHQELWIANLMMKNKDAYFQMENGERVFKNDKEFLEMVSSSMEAIKTQNRNMRSVSNAYAEYIVGEVNRGQYNKVDWIIRGTDGQPTTSKNDFIHQASLLHSRGNRKGTNTSRQGQVKTKKAIQSALTNPENLSVSGFMPSGSQPGTYVMTLKVPAATSRANGTDTSAFEVQFEINSVDNVQAIFADSHRIAKNISTGNFDAVETVNLGLDSQNPNLMNIATVDYIYDHNSKTPGEDYGSFVPRSVINSYKLEDLDQYGQPKSDANGVIRAPVSTNTYIGNWILDELFAQDMEALKNTEHFTMYQSFLSAHKISSEGLEIFD